MRILFFNEGNLGTHVMGQAQLEAALHVGLGDLPDVQARFARLSPMGRAASAMASRPLPPLSNLGLDFRSLRWHLVQSLRARRLIMSELASWTAQYIHLHSQSVAMTMGSIMRELPVALSVDATVRDWWNMPAWRPTEPHAAVAIAPSAALERRAFHRAAVVLAWTAWARNAVLRAAPHANVIEHHPGLDLEHYRPAPRRPRELPRLLFVGGRFAGKGGEDLLAALGGDLGERVELDLVTPAPVAERRGVRVHRLGPSDPQLLDLQQQADLFCLPSGADAAPWAVLEAMACATPVLSSHVGGIPDMLEGGRGGALVQAGDRRGLREAVLALIANPDARARLAARARERCELRYDARLQAARLVEHLQWLPGARPGGSG